MSNVKNGDFTDEKLQQKQKYIENPCYHCYAGASDQCYMMGCKYQFKRWAKDVDSEYIEDYDSEL